MVGIFLGSLACGWRAAELQKQLLEGQMEGLGWVLTWQDPTHARWSLLGRAWLLWKTDGQVLYVVHLATHCIFTLQLAPGPNVTQARQKRRALSMSGCSRGSPRSVDVAYTRVHNVLAVFTIRSQRVHAVSRGLRFELQSKGTL